MPTERPYLRLVGPSETRVINWHETPHSLEELVLVTDFLPNEIDAAKLTPAELTTLLNNLTEALNPIDEVWTNSLNQFTEWETVFTRLEAAKTVINQIDATLSNTVETLQTLVLTAITEIGTRNEMDSNTNNNPAFVFLLRLLKTRPEFTAIIQPKFKDKHNSPISNRTGETGLLDWVEHQKDLDQIGQLLDNATSLPELLHLLSLVHLNRVTVHRTADYSTNYTIISFINYIITEAERLAIGPATPNLQLNKRREELQRLCEPTDGSQNAFFPPNLGEFKTRGFIYQQLTQEFEAMLGSLSTEQTPEPQSWIQLLWYVENAVDPHQVFAFTKKDGNVEHIMRITGDEIHQIVSQAPLRANDISLLPLATEISFVRPEDRFIVGLREKLETWFG